LGVHAGIEVLKTLNDNNITTEYPTGVINWTNEEGARFPISMIASGVWAGAYSLEKAYGLVEVGGGSATQKSELERIGYLGPLEASYKANPIGAHFELHIEQGPILEKSNGKIGAVEGVQAYRWVSSSLATLWILNKFKEAFANLNRIVPHYRKGSRLPYWHDRLPKSFRCYAHGCQVDPP